MALGQDAQINTLLIILSPAAFMMMIFTHWHTAYSYWIYGLYHVGNESGAITTIQFLI